MTEEKNTNTLNGYTIQSDDLPEDLVDIAEQIDLDAVLRLIELRGGELVYIPKAKSVTRSARTRALIEECDGKNHHYLARKYGYSLALVYAMIQKDRGIT